MLLRAQTVFLLRPRSNIGRVLVQTERFRRHCSGMDKPSEDSKSTGDVMADSFGVGYATRSEEEGFGGVYSDSQQLKKNANHIVDDDEEHDKTQGSEVKEKETGRNSHKDAASK